jgi:hypothetical protein
VIEAKFKGDFELDRAVKGEWFFAGSAFVFFWSE